MFLTRAKDIKKSELFPFYWVIPVEEGLLFGANIPVGNRIYPITKTFKDMRMLPHQIIECSISFFKHAQEQQQILLHSEEY